MNLLDSVKKISGNLALKQAMAKSSKPAEVMTFEKASKFAILFYMTSEAEVNALNELIAFLWVHNKNTYIVGGTSGFPVPKSKYTNTNFLLLKEDEIGWNQMPKGYRVTSYLEHEFDVVIDMAQEDYLPLLFMLASAKAKIKVGRYDRNTHDQYHFMIDTRKKPDIFNFTTQLKQYLFSL